MTPTVCPHCGRPDFETFLAGDREVGVRSLSHIGCVLMLKEECSLLRAQLKDLYGDYNSDVTKLTVEITQLKNELKSLRSATLEKEQNPDVPSP